MPAVAGKRKKFDVAASECFCSCGADKRSSIFFSTRTRQYGSQHAIVSMIVRSIGNWLAGGLVSWWTAGLVGSVDWGPLGRMTRSTGDRWGCLLWPLLLSPGRVLWSCCRVWTDVVPWAWYLPCLPRKGDDPRTDLCQVSPPLQESGSGAYLVAGLMLAAVIHETTAQFHLSEVSPLWHPSIAHWNLGGLTQKFCRVSSTDKSAMHMESSPLHVADILDATCTLAVFYRQDVESVVQARGALLVNVVSRSVGAKKRTGTSWFRGISLSHVAAVPEMIGKYHHSGCLQPPSRPRYRSEAGDKGGRVQDWTPLFLLLFFSFVFGRYPCGFADSLVFRWYSMMTWPKTWAMG